MRSMRSEPVRALLAEPWLIAALIAACVLFTLRPLGLAVTPSIVALLLCICLVFVSTSHLLTQWRGLPYLNLTLLTLALGHLGFLGGIALDMGTTGLLSLASWCSARESFGLHEVWTMLQLAPLAHIGMQLGCNLAMLTGLCGERPVSRTEMPRWLFVLLCNLGMVFGMFAASVLLPLTDGGSLPFAAIAMLGQMLLGMLLGMLGVWWWSERLTRRLEGDLTPVRGGVR